MGTDPSLSISRRRDRVYGLAIIVLAFGGCMGLSVWGMRFSTPRPAPTPLPASPEDIVGFPSTVRPFELVERARGLTVRERFRGFEAKGVQADGTMDLSQPGTSLRFAFQSAQGRGPQPERKPGTLPSRRFCGTQSVVLNQTGIGALPDRPSHACGSDDVTELPLPVACSIEQLFKLAEQRKIKRKGTAVIEFFESASGPAFRFEKDRRSFVIAARDCRTELKGRDQRGILPRP